MSRKLDPDRFQPSAATVRSHVGSTGVMMLAWATGYVRLKH